MDWAISGGILLLLVAMVAVAVWTLWRLWREWPQRCFGFAGRIVSRERYPVSYWLGLGFGSTLAVAVALQGLRFLVAGFARLMSN